MSKHVSYRGATIDMDSMRRENEKSSAVGNMPVNARGDQIKGGVIVKTADEIAREKSRVQSVVVSTGLKGAVPKDVQEDVPALSTKSKSVTPTTKKKETELPNGDIVMGEE